MLTTIQLPSPGSSERRRPRRDLRLGRRGLHRGEGQDHGEARQDEDGLVVCKIRRGLGAFTNKIILKFKQCFL